MLMSLNKDETAVNGCHYNGVIWYVVRMHKVLAILRSWYGASVLLKIGMVSEGLQQGIIFAYLT